MQMIQDGAFANAPDKPLRVTGSSESVKVMPNNIEFDLINVLKYAIFCDDYSRKYEGYLGLTSCITPGDYLTPVSAYLVQLFFWYIFWQFSVHSLCFRGCILNPLLVY